MLIARQLKSSTLLANLPECAEMISLNAFKDQGPDQLALGRRYPGLFGAELSIAKTGAYI